MSTEVVAKKVKKRVNSKAKGSGYESQIAKKLTVALAPLTFIRTPGSGSRVGGSNYAVFGKMFGEDAMKIFVGDVVPTNERDVGLRFRMSIECKFYKTPDTLPGLVSGNANLLSWFNESVVDAVKVGKEPCLIFKWNNTKTYVAVLPGKQRISPSLTISQNGITVDIYNLDDVLYERDFWLG